MGIIDDYFDGYYSEEMIESQVSFSRQAFSFPWMFAHFISDVDKTNVKTAHACVLHMAVVVIYFLSYIRLINLFSRSWCERDFPNWVRCFLKPAVSGLLFSFLINCLLDTFLSLFYNAVNHLDFLGVQIAWVTGPWFLSIFMNMLPWESGQVLCCCFYLCDMMLPIQKHLILVLENS